jgi:NAD(P)-dependent dehydrogenase (short-subunit alcohol dehydrogenase family)
MALRVPALDGSGNFGLAMRAGSRERRTRLGSERIVLVIGGANGIGGACSRLMAARGWRVLIGDKDFETARHLAAEIGAHAFAADVSSMAAMEDLAAGIEGEIGPVASLVVSSAVFQENLPVAQTPIEVWERVMRVNLDGTYFANRAFGTRMAARGAGSIVNVASLVGMASSPVHAYGSSKAGVINLTQCLAGEWGRAGVRVNCVSPGVTLVSRVIARLKAGARYHGDPGSHLALGRCVEPNEVAEGIEFLASDRASAITGINLPIDAGWLVAGIWEMYGGVRPATGPDSGAIRAL